MVWTQGRRDTTIAAVALSGITLHLILRFAVRVRAEWIGHPIDVLPLLVALACGAPLLYGLGRNLARFEFGSDLLAGVSIVTAVLLGEYLAGAVIVLMLAGGQALEAYAVRSAASALAALARRLPSGAHKVEEGGLADVPLDRVVVGDILAVFPHEACPVDGVVIDGRSAMDESYLTGEPYVLSKAPGSTVLSGAMNGEGVLRIRAEKTAVDSRYAKIMQVMRDAEQRRPRLRRLGDQLGAVYNPVAMAIAVITWAATGDATRFLAVLIVATPCPLILAIPVAIVGSISLAARRGIVLRDPSALEQVSRCRTAIFDKTGTLTYGRASVTSIEPADGVPAETLLRTMASLERYSRHPLAAAVLDAARRSSVSLQDVEAVSERPGEGLRGVVNGRSILITSRAELARQMPDAALSLPAPAGGLECVVAIDGRYAGLCRFRDAPRAEGKSFVRHLARHGFARVLLVSGDRESEVRYLAEQVGITDVHAGQSPEQKLALVRAETRRAPTLFVGDGINDAPALAASTVGVAFGQQSDVTSDAAGAVVLDQSLQRVDELLHVGRRMRRIALQSAVGGMVLSVLGMAFAATGLLLPVEGAIAQEVIDVLAVLNALRAATMPRTLSDC